MSVARVWALPGLGGMGGLRAEFAAGTETPHPSHRKKQALPAVHPNSKPCGLASPDLHAIIILFARDVAERSRCQSEHDKLVEQCEGVEVLSTLDLVGHLL